MTTELREWPVSVDTERKGWDVLKPTTRAEYERNGITRAFYEFGMPMEHARKRQEWDDVETRRRRSYVRRGVTRELYDYGLSLLAARPSESRANGTAGYRKGWDELSDGTRARYERAGMTRETYQSGETVTRLMRGTGKRRDTDNEQDS